MILIHSFIHYSFTQYIYFKYIYLKIYGVLGAVVGTGDIFKNKIDKVPA